MTWYSSSPSTNFKFWKGFNVLYSSFLYVHKRCRFPHCDGIKSLVDYLLESMFLFWSVINLSTKFQRAFERRGKKPNQFTCNYCYRRTDKAQNMKSTRRTTVHSMSSSMTIHDLFFLNCCITNIMSSAFDAFRFFSFLRQVVSVFLSSILTFFSVLPTFFIINRFTFVISVISIAANV